MQWTGICALHEAHASFAPTQLMHEHRKVPQSADAFLRDDIGGIRERRTLESPRSSKPFVSSPADILSLCRARSQHVPDLQGRNAVVFGVANKRSIAWSIAQGLHAAGMKLAITYQNERLEQEAEDHILSLPGAEAYMCDVSKDEESPACSPR